MNILVVSESFSMGGLETHINTLYEGSKEKNKFVFAFGKYKKGEYLKDAIIEEDFHFSFDSTVKDFLEDVDRLIEIIDKHNVDTIICHPFYSVFPAVFAAHLTDTTISYVCHGSGSINFTQLANDNLLWNFITNNLLDSILCVSTKLMEGFKKSEIVHFVPNIIDEKKYIESKIPFNGNWATVARLDVDKKNELLKIINNYDLLGINKLDIFGDGICKQELIDAVKQNKLSDKISFKGYVTDMQQELLNNYDGVIGLGRVAEEAMVMGIPVLLSGYGKINGLVDKKMYKQLKNYNFVNIWLPELSIQTIGNQIKSLSKKNIKDYSFRDDVIKDFGIKKCDNYIKLINEKSVVSISDVKVFIDELRKIDNKDNLIYKDIDIFYRITMSFSRYSFNNEWYNMITSYKYLLIGPYSEVNQNSKEILNDIKEIKKNITELKKEKEKIKNIENNYKKLKELIENSNQETIRLNNDVYEIKTENNKTINSINNLNDEVSKITLGRLIKRFIKNKTGRNKPEIIAILNVFNEELNIAMCIKHLYKYVDKIVVFDDASTDNTRSIVSSIDKVVLIENKNKEKWAERYNRETSLRKAYEIAETPYPWVLCVDADERFEDKFLKDLSSICVKYAGTNKVITIHFRELWGCLDKYRSDGIWDLKEKGLLFQLCENMTFNYEQEHHIPWAYREIVNNREFLEYNLYHLKMIKKEDRIKRRDLYNTLDPNKEMQPIGYDYLVDDNNLELSSIENKKFRLKYVPKYYKTRDDE